MPSAWRFFFSSLHRAFYWTVRTHVVSAWRAHLELASKVQWPRRPRKTHSITPELMLGPSTVAHTAILNPKTDQQRMPSLPVSDDLWISILADRRHCEAYLLFLHILVAVYSRIGFLLLNAVVPSSRWRRLSKWLFPWAKDAAKCFWPIFANPQVEPTASCTNREEGEIYWIKYISYEFPDWEPVIYITLK